MSESTVPQRASIRSIQRVLQVMTAVGAYPDGATARLISDDTGIPLGSVHGLLVALESEGCAVRADHGRWQLGWRIASLEDRRRLQQQQTGRRPAAAPVPRRQSARAPAASSAPRAPARAGALYEFALRVEPPAAEMHRLACGTVPMSDPRWYACSRAYAQRVVAERHLRPCQVCVPDLKFGAVPPAEGALVAGDSGP